MNVDERKKLYGAVNELRGVFAHRATKTGRRRDEHDEDPFTINPFRSDQAKILSSKTFRAMGKKTQVFTLPETPLIRSRLAHVMEVVACSIVPADLLGLNVDLVHAAALGHDVGHVPLGHQGEMWMQNEMGQPIFCHEVMGPIVTQKIERKGKGLNLTFETLEAMMCHSGNKARQGMSEEAWLLRYTDKFAYLFHDYNDIFVRRGYPPPGEIREIADYFGSNQRERVSTAMAGLIVESADCKKVCFEHSDLGQKFKQFRTLMYEIYPKVTQQNVDRILRPVLEFLRMIDVGDPFLILALMTDEDVLRITEREMKDTRDLNRTAVHEIVPYLREIGSIDLCNPYLDW